MLREENSWRIDLAEITKAIKTNTKCIIINFPHNPTGAIITKEELQGLVDICRQHDIWLFSDEVYYGLGTPQKGWASPVCSLYDKALSLNVMSKSFGMAGLRVGWLACQDKNILHKIKQIKDYLSICCSAPAEIISIIAMQNREYIWHRNNEIIRHNFALLEEFLRQYSELFSWVKPQGGCIGFVKYHGKETVNDFCDKLVKAKGVLLMPANIYDHDSNHFRVGFGRKNMPDALERLKDFLNENL
ncbi:MAG: aminotransferase class I/II-fold pyridoxal phosphate-dependent enzyme [Rickettsiaceae bacterium]|nr:aminotransferase class I/II-fold pyridoxal phosphate-dependent enzyme [Rickettsiaceae bacterium]